MKLDLHKMNERRTTVLNLKKEIGLDNQIAEVVLVLDYSLSMSSLYANGTVQQTLERLLPLALGFDDNGSIDAYLFHDRVISLPVNVTLKTLEDYVARQITGKYSMGGTSYAPVINAIVEQFGKTRGGILGIGTRPAPREAPVYVIFITDGENSYTDRPKAETAIRDASEHGIFFQFVGIGSERFEFLSKLDNLTGRTIDNANFFKVPDLNLVTDDQLYKLLLAEFPQFIKAAKSQRLLL